MRITHFSATALLTFLALGLHAGTVSTYLLGGWTFQREGESTPQTVTIPHDWAIAGPFDKEVDKQVVAITQNGERIASEKTGRSGSLPWIGEADYTRSVFVSDTYTHAELVFDGAMSEPKVYVNGELAGCWMYGYSSFILDITPYVRFGQENRLTVHLTNREESSRWYPGAGLYRPVRLVLGQDTGLKTWGTFVRTPSVQGIAADGRSAATATVAVTSEIRSSRPLAKGRKLTVNQLVRNRDGLTLAEGVSAVVSSTSDNRGLAGMEATTTLHISRPELWSPENPVLYTLVTRLYEGTELVDSAETSFGIRTLRFSAEGFELNGIVRKIKGVCLHHDLGPLGAAFNKAAFARQVKILKEMGCDAIRTSHNMPAPWQMDICDELGMMVMAESFDTWVYPKVRNGYASYFHQPNPNGFTLGARLPEGSRQKEWWESDVENLVRCHRNHPSIILWSIGNEIPDQGNSIGLEYTRLMHDLCHRLDPTRLCTQGLDRGMAPIQSGVLQATDVPGINYRLQRYLQSYENAPQGFILGSETASTVSSRGVYKFPAVRHWSKAYDDGQCSSYDLEACSWSNLPDDDWLFQDDAPWVLGEFVWTGFDYLGEPTPYDGYWPSRSSYFGIVDLAGLPKDRYWLYRSRWNTTSPTIHLLPHWNWTGREGEPTPVYCYTDCPEAELFVNGVSQGRIRKQNISLDDAYGKGAMDGTLSGEKALQAAGGKTTAIPEGKDQVDRYRLRWNDVPYRPGELKVVVYDTEGRPAGEKTLRTAGKPHHLVLTADRDCLKATPTGADGYPTDAPDLAFVTVQIVDREGNPCPDADIPLIFRTKGTVRFNSCCNGDATSTEPFCTPRMKTFHGALVVVLEAGSQAGSAVLTVKGEGVVPATLSLSVK